MKTAADLYKKAEVKLAVDRAQIDYWIGETTKAVIDWCDKEAMNGQFYCVINYTDLSNLIPAATPQDKIYRVMLSVKHEMEKVGYNFIINCGVGHPQITSITVNWAIVK